MNPAAIRQATELLVEARRTGALLDGLPSTCRPRTADEAHAIQDATAEALGEKIAGWKVGAPIDGQVTRGAILASRIVASGGTIAAAQVPLLGVEAEIAFRFDRSLGPRSADYTHTDVAAAVTAFAAIEVVDSRFRDYSGTSLIERLADCMSNGAFVEGAMQPEWLEFDLSKLKALLEIDGKPIVDRIGGHSTGDPLLPAIDLVNAFRRGPGVRAGQIMTTGTYTGLNFAKPGQRVRAVFEGFGSAEVQF